MLCTAVLADARICLAAADSQGHDKAAGSAPAKEDVCKGILCGLNLSPGPRMLAIVESTHQHISHGLESTVRLVDNFFARDNVFEESTGSYARIPLDAIWQENDGYRYKASIKARIDLPKSKKKLKLLFESDVTEEQALRLSSTPGEAVSDNDFFLSIERELNKSGKWSVRPALGIKFRWPPDPFARLRAIRYFSFSSWLLRLSSTGVYFAINGFETRGSFEISKALTRNLLFRSFSDVRWREKKDLTDASQVFSIYQHLTAKENIAYQTGVFADNKPDWDITDYRTWIRFRRLIHQNWLFIEIRPEVRFPNEGGYDPTYLVQFRVEAVFGENLPDKLRNIN